MMMKKYIAESYYEAFLKAQTELGEDVLVVTSRTFSNSSWGGFYSKEMVEITAMAPKPRPAGRPVRQAPSKPMPSEELSIDRDPRWEPRRPAPSVPGTGRGYPVPQTSSIEGSNPISRASDLSPEGAPPEPHRRHPIRPLPSRSAGGSISAAGGPGGPLPSRSPGGSVSPAGNPGVPLPIGREEPPSPFEDAETSHDERVAKLLEAILTTKQGRPPAPEPGAAPAQDLRSNKSFHHLEKKISEIFSLLSEMQKSSAVALATSPRRPPGLEYLQERLAAAEIPPHILEEILGSLEETVSPAAKKDPFLARKEFSSWMREKLRFGRIPEKASGPRTSILIGPTGVGKTTTVAKLAATFALNVVERKSVALLTTDTYRIGATEQLARYAQIIEAEFEIIIRPDDIPDLLEKHQAKDILLVDTAGRCQKQHQELRELREFIDRFPQPTKFLVLSATTKYSDMLENVRRFGDVGFDHLIFTKVDETNSVGPLLGLLYETSACLAYVTHGQQVPDDFCQADAEFFLSRLFKGD